MKKSFTKGIASVLLGISLALGPCIVTNDINVAQAQVTGHDAYHANPDECWNGNKNYPMAYSHMKVDYYVDLSSAYILSQGKDDDGIKCTTVRFNMVFVPQETGEIYKTALLEQVIKLASDGISVWGYDPANGKLVALDSVAGTDIGAYNAGWIVADHFEEQIYHGNY